MAVDVQNATAVQPYVSTPEDDDDDEEVDWLYQLTRPRVPDHAANKEMRASVDLFISTHTPPSSPHLLLRWAIHTPPSTPSSPHRLPCWATPSRPVKTALVIDNDEEHRAYAVLALKELGFAKPMQARDAGEGLAKLKERVIDVVLSERLGYIAAFREWERNNRPGKRQTIFCVTVEGDEDVWGYGMDTVLRKPFSLMDLSNTIACLRDRQALCLDMVSLKYVSVMYGSRAEAMVT